jgi:exodeoxyribonuclease VII large subunit
VETKKQLSLSELQRMVAGALNAAFPMPVWVAAEISELKVNGSGHCYMELVERTSTEISISKTTGGGSGGSGSGSSGFGGGSGLRSGSDSGSGGAPKAQARAVAWRGVWASLSAYFRGVTGSLPAAGMKVLVKVTVSYHELYGFSLVVSDIDPSYTLGEAERVRRETIVRLQSDGVLDMNRGVDIEPVVQRVAVISSATAAGWRDFAQELARYPWRFEVTLFEATMQGAQTTQTVVAALEQIAFRADEFDAVAVIRGGGSVADLAAFDDYRLASHIAQFPLPVLTGIGHDKDRSVTDMVAFREFKTPTAVAVWLGERLGDFDALLDGFSERVFSEAAAILESAAARLERAGRVVSLGATEMTRRMEVRLERLSGDVARLSGERLLREKLRLEGSEAAVRERPFVILSRSAERLDGFERVVALRRPENILALGFAIVRTISSDGAVGAAVTDASVLPDGQPLEITVAKGTFKVKKHE